MKCFLVFIDVSYWLVYQLVYERSRPTFCVKDLSSDLRGEYPVRIDGYVL
jgi:hypothetical protein